MPAPGWLLRFVEIAMPTYRAPSTGAFLPSLVRPLRTGLVCWTLWGLGALAPVAAQSTPAGGQLPSDWSAMTQRWLDDALSREASPASPALPLRMEVTVGTLDPRLRLAPCTRVEPYLPAGTRLWGRTRLGLRCVEGGTPWNVFLPVTVKAFGPAWVVTRPVAPGATLTPEDAMESEVDWAAENSPVAANPDLWVGQIAARALVPGQALRQSMVRPPQVFKVGAQVRVVAQGPGFAIAAMGQAMAAGAVGQTVRVRMDNGKIVSGIVSADGTIAVSM